MAKLQTLEDIGVEREKLYGQLMSNQINEQRAIAGERVLAGQQKLKEMPFKVLQMFTRMKSMANEERQGQVLNVLLFNMGITTDTAKSIARK